MHIHTLAHTYIHVNTICTHLILLVQHFGASLANSLHLAEEKVTKHQKKRGKNA